MASFNGKDCTAAGGLTAIGAAVRCIGSLLLPGLGLGGAWIGKLIVRGSFLPAVGAYSNGWSAKASVTKAFASFRAAGLGAIRVGRILPVCCRRPLQRERYPNPISIGRHPVPSGLSAAQGVATGHDWPGARFHAPFGILKVESTPNPDRFSRPCAFSGD